MSVRDNHRSSIDCLRPIPDAEAVVIHDESYVEFWDQYVEFIEDHTRDYDGIFRTKNYRILQNGLQMVVNWWKYSNGGDTISYADYARGENRDLWGRLMGVDDGASQLYDPDATSFDGRSINGGRPDIEEYEPFKGGP